MALTDANFADNRRTLTQNLVGQLGLDGTAPGDWSYDQRLAFNRGFATFVLSHPASFSAQDFSTAQTVNGEHPSELSDTSVSADLSAFGSAVVDNVVSAGGAVAGIGTGVLNLASMGKYLIPLAGLAVLGIGIYAFYKKQTA